ncbi:hypothetical protein [Tenacibaculum holothuriorum]|uniref:hypothetical protein n=1 Tax=Tenacibaculum holothuriorum TaxID=1635173 RepID=UPI0013022BDC|nr:hypothetical protein [Tenacibaculum holothuriorum]
MKNLRKIIALFIGIFITGIIVTVVSINSTLKKEQPKEDSLKVVQDSTYLLKSEKKAV